MKPTGAPPFVSAPATYEPAIQTVDGVRPVSGCRTMDVLRVAPVTTGRLRRMPNVRVSMSQGSAPSFFL